MSRKTGILLAVFGSSNELFISIIDVNAYIITKIDDEIDDDWLEKEKEKRNRKD